MSIYQKHELARQNVFQRLFKIQPKENFILEFLMKYKVNFTKDYWEDRKNFYRKYLQSVLADEQVTEDEVKCLSRLKNVLALNESFVKNELTKMTSEIYRNKVVDSISDGKLDDAERVKLDELKKNLLLSDDVAQNIYGEEAKKILTNFVNNAISDERLSPDEEKQIDELAKNLGTDVSYGEKTKGLLNKYRLFWVIENGEIPTIESDINLQKSENLYFKTDINWLEMKTVTTRVNYAGVGTRIRICKGVYFKVGSVAPERVTEDVWKTIDSGILYLTNKRVIFVGAKGNKQLKLDKILSFVPYLNGVSIDKDSGKKTFFEFENNVDLFAMMLSRLMNQ